MYTTQYQIFYSFLFPFSTIISVFPENISKYFDVLQPENISLAELCQNDLCNSFFTARLYFKKTQFDV